MGLYILSEKITCRTVLKIEIFKEPDKHNTNYAHVLSLFLYQMNFCATT